MSSKNPNQSRIAASVAIPLLYRFPLLYLEPIFAFNGAILVLFKPDSYLSTMTRQATTSVIDSSTQFIYTELAGGWLHLAFTEAVVLRYVDDVKVWRLICTAMLLSDIAYCHSCAQAVGGWQVWLQVTKWTLEDWIVTITTWPFALARVAIACKLGWK